MKILFLCSAHNSLSQRLYLALSRAHEVSIEFALNDELMISAVALFGPDLVICPFLTSMVPKEIYAEYLTLIIHPGPPGDAGPSALDWVLMGDDGTVNDPEQLLVSLDHDKCNPGRSHWGITVLQAIEEFDAGPVWAFEQFELDIDQPGLTKSELYRGPVTQSAISATFTAISRIQSAAKGISVNPKTPSSSAYSPRLQAELTYGRLSVGNSTPFQGGKLHRRPLLKAAQRQFNLSRHNAQQISRRIRCGDSQPGVLSKVFGPNLYVYGGIIDDNADERLPTLVGSLPSTILGTRNGAICLATIDGKGVWITHVRRLKSKTDMALWAKAPATSGLLELGLINDEDVHSLHWPLALDWKRTIARTFQEVWVDWTVDDQHKKTAYLYFDFYNGAMATSQCSHLIEAMDFIISESTGNNPVQAVVLMGGSYFSNGIALNVIEAAQDPSTESWLNINRIDDVVHYILHEFPSHDIITIAAIRGNAAAGGVALAAACDFVVCGSNVVLNPAYRAVGLYGSEYHTLSYPGRCGEASATKILRSMTPLSPMQAQSMGLVDYIFPGTGNVLKDHIRAHVAYLLKPAILKRGLWKRGIDTTPAALARVRANELGEMSLDFWSARSIRYHSRRFDFVRKVKSTRTPLRFATHRRKFDETRKDEEETDEFDSVGYFQQRAQDNLVAMLRKTLAREVSSALTNRDEKSRQDSVLAPVDSGADMPRLEQKMETVFSCYYKPPVEDVPTPPKSPLSPTESVGDVTIVQ